MENRRTTFTASLIFQVFLEGYQFTYSEIANDQEWSHVGASGLTSFETRQVTPRVKIHAYHIESDTCTVDSYFTSVYACVSCIVFIRFDSCQDVLCGTKTTPSSTLSCVKKNSCE